MVIQEWRKKEILNNFKLSQTQSLGVLISRCIAKLHAVTATGWSVIAFSFSTGLLIYLGIFAAGSQLFLFLNKWSILP
jgi:hypothetical protein